LQGCKACISNEEFLSSLTKIIGYHNFTLDKRLLREKTGKKKYLSFSSTENMSHAAAPWPSKTQQCIEKKRVMMKTEKGLGNTYFE